MTAAVRHFLAGLAVACLGVCRAAETPVTAVVARPASLRLAGPDASYSLLLDGRTAAGRTVDLTRTARYRTLDPAVARVTETGVVRAAGDGRTEVLVEVAGRSLRVPVEVAGTAARPTPHFENDVVPILSRFGCNSSGCHGKAEGQNGFRLSVFGYDPAADHAALTKEARGRRVFPPAPDSSLLLRKISGGLPHGGGVRLPPGGAEYETLRRWIAAGAPFGDPRAPRVAAIRLEPRERVLAVRSGQQLRVVARYEDGREQDVTALARFQSNNEGLAAVTAGGLVTVGDSPGDVAVMASYLGAVDTFRALVPREGPGLEWPPFPEDSFIDRLVADRLRRLNITPSGQADDAEFLRRVYLDLLGVLPTPAEARRFLADRDPDRRARLVDELLARPEFADYWALKWADLLRVDRQALGHKRAYAYYRWIRDGLAKGKPLDRFARELLTAEGPLGEVAPAAFYKAVGKPGEAASTLSQVLLGVRIACAECHHHPFDRWSQTDYYGMQAFFAPVAVRQVGGEELLAAAGAASAKNPRTGEEVPAHPLGRPAPASPQSGDRRADLAAWLTAPDNPFFARNLANRVWAHLLGRGLVEPVDDVRATNPPTNPELLDALARHLVEQRYDLRGLVRAVVLSQTYQRSSQPNATNELDEQNYSRARLKRVEAEVLFDMICQATGVPERFAGMPPGTRAVQLWDSKVSHPFLKLFGRPVRVSACECERGGEPGVAQVLHLLNSPGVQARLGHADGTVARLVRRTNDDRELVEGLYLAFYSRPPGEAERRQALAYLSAGKDDRRRRAEDLAWGLLNSLEFLFNH